ncbi:hypothetical protein [Staphylococcus caeli]
MSDDDKIQDLINNNDLPIDDHWGEVSNGKPEHFNEFLKIIFGGRVDGK